MVHRRLLQNEKRLTRKFLALCHKFTAMSSSPNQRVNKRTREYACYIFETTSQTNIDLCHLLFLKFDITLQVWSQYWKDIGRIITNEVIVPNLNRPVKDNSQIKCCLSSFPCTAKHTTQKPSWIVTILLYWNLHMLSFGNDDYGYQ